MPTKKEKYELLCKKYFTLNKVPYIYLNNIPNRKEFINNASWRVSLDSLIEYFLPGLGDNPFYKEVIYNGANIPSALTSSYNRFPIGSLNATYGPMHALYAVSRFGMKISYISLYVYNDYNKYFPEIKTPENIKIASDALRIASGNANYIIDPAIRWIPLMAEREQMGINKESSLSIILVTSILGGIVRTAGSQLGGYLLTAPSKACQKYLLYPVASLFKLEENVKSEKPSSAIQRILDAKSPFSMVGIFAYEITSKFILNAIATVISAPFSRAPGQAVEELGDYFATNDDLIVQVGNQALDNHTEF